jgi:Holliday junction resolvase RusA-like endonuclease
MTKQPKPNERRHRVVDGDVITSRWDAASGAWLLYARTDYVEATTVTERIEPSTRLRSIDVTIHARPCVKGNSKRIIKMGTKLTLRGSALNEAHERALRFAIVKRRLDAGIIPIEGPVCVDVTFGFAPAASLSEKKRLTLLGTSHTQSPDRGNLLKLIEDVISTNAKQEKLDDASLIYDDSAIADGNVRKVWTMHDVTTVKITQLPFAGPF